MLKTQFDLNAMLSTPAVLQNAVKQIPCSMLRPYHNHRFEMYTGERFDDMVESIRENGVLSPIVVQPCEGEYEILIGHNRWNASKTAGLETVPAIIKEGLTPEEAEMYVIESNLIQRGFDNLKISEQAAVIAQRHSEMFSQGKRNDIIRELQIIEGKTETTSFPVGTKLDNGDSKQNIADNYKMGRTSVARFIRIDKLIDDIKIFIDNGSLAVRSGVEISFLSEMTQKEIARLIEDYPVDMKKAKFLRTSADEKGNVSNADIIRILDGKKDISDKGKSVKISAEAFERYFPNGIKKKDITETIEKALELYFSEMEER